MDERREALRRAALSEPDDQAALRGLAREQARAGEILDAYQALIKGGIPPEDPQAIALGRSLARREQAVFRRRHGQDTRFAVARGLPSRGRWLFQNQEQHRRLRQPTRAILRMNKALPKSLLRQRARLPCLEELHLSNCRLAGDVLAELAAGPPLDALSLSHVGLSFAELGRLAPIGLRALELTKVRPADGLGLEELAALGELRSLSILDTPVSGLELTRLTGLPLRSLRLIAPRGIDAEAIAAIAAISGLRSLNLSSFDLESARLEKLGALPLEELRLGPGSLQDLAALSRFPALKILALKPGPGEAPTLLQLEELDLSYAAIESPIPEWIARLPRLRALDLTGARGVVCRDLGSLIDRLAEGAELKDLSLARTGDPDRDLAKLTRLPGLRVLDLSGSDIDGAELAALAALPILEELRLSDTELCDSDLACLKSFPALRSLSLDGCFRLSKEAIPSLGALPGLRRLNLARSGVSLAIAEVELAHIPLLILQQ